MPVREHAADLRESAASSCEVELTTREQLTRARDEAYRARVEADEARADLERLLVQMRAANEKLVVSADAQADDANVARAMMAASHKALRESEARYRALFDSIDEGFCVIEVLYDRDDNPEDFRYLEANPAFEKQTGLHDVVGKRIRELAPDVEGSWAQTYGGVIATGEPVRFINEAKPLNRWFDVYAFRIGDPVSRRVACLFTDITARRREQQIAGHLAAIVTSTNDAVITKNLRDVIESWNEGARRLFGYAAEEVIGQSASILIPPDRLNEELEILDRIGRGETIEHYETVRRRKDGSLVDISLALSPLRDADGHVIGAAKVARDITERKRADAQILATSRAKDEFLAMLGHELRNPLAPIITALDLMSMGKPAVFERERSIIGRQVDYLVHLVDDLLDVSRITGGKVHLVREPIELAEIVSRAVETVSPLLETKAHQLTIQVPERGLLVDGDVSRLAQIVANLLTNAAKYSPSRGSIVVCGERDNSTVVLRVRDSGIGISPEMLPHVFELFAQERQAIDRSRGGLGLGLAIVKSLVTMHGGTVSASSAGFGQGSEFVIELPISTAGVQSPRRAAPATRTIALATRKVLVVDDNRDAAELTADLLKAVGHVVRVAFDGPSALAFAEDFGPDVVLLDIGLPVMDGFELAARLKPRLAPRETPFIAITGYGQAIDRQRTRDAGFALHLVKPVTVAALREGIDQVTARPSRLRDECSDGTL